MFEPNLYAELSKKERHHLQVKLPITKDDGTEVVVPMVTLTGRERYEVESNADKDTLAMFGNKRPHKDEVSAWEKVYNDHLAVWTIYYAVRVPGRLNDKLFPNKEAVLDIFTDDQLGIMWNQYLTVQLNQPSIIALPDDDEDKVEALMNKIIEAGSTDKAFFLNSLTSQTANVLISFMAARLKSLQTTNGSPGMPPEDGTQSK